MSELINLYEKLKESVAEYRRICKEDTYDKRLIPIVTDGNDICKKINDIITPLYYKSGTQDIHLFIQGNVLPSELYITIYGYLGTSYYDYRVNEEDIDKIMELIDCWVKFEPSEKWLTPKNIIERYEFVNRMDQMRNT